MTFDGLFDMVLESPKVLLRPDCHGLLATHLLGASSANAYPEIDRRLHRWDMEMERLHEARMFAASTDPTEAANHIRPSRTPQRLWRELLEPQKRKKRKRQNDRRAPGCLQPSRDPCRCSPEPSPFKRSGHNTPPSRHDPKLLL